MKTNLETLVMGFLNSQNKEDWFRLSSVVSGVSMSSTDNLNFRSHFSPIHSMSILSTLYALARQGKVETRGAKLTKEEKAALIVANKKVYEYRIKRNEMSLTYNVPASTSQSQKI